MSLFPRAHAPLLSMPCLPQVLQEHGLWEGWSRGSRVPRESSAKTVINYFGLSFDSLVSLTFVHKHADRRAEVLSQPATHNQF